MAVGSRWTCQRGKVLPVQALSERCPRILIARPRSDLSSCLLSTLRGFMFMWTRHLLILQVCVAAATSADASNMNKSISISSRQKKCAPVGPTRHWQNDES